MESLPVEIQHDILLRLPLQSLFACSRVWRKLKTVICNEYFKNRYLLRSMTKPMDPTPDSFFDTACQKENHLVEWTRSAPTRGVVCLQASTSFLLCSAITNNVLRLPDIKWLGLTPERFFLGYDEATSSLKVLWPRIYSNPIVYTVSLGGEGSWREIACETYHMAIFSCALCKGGVLYYPAKALPLCLEKSIVMCFNVNSETFDCNQLPEGVSLPDDAPMVNYNGKVALVATELQNTGEFEICVRNEVSGEWELHQLVIPGWRDNVGNDVMFSFVGTIGTGELVFTAPDSLHDGSESVLHYNTNPPQGKKKFKMFSVEAVNGGSYHYVRACLDHFDSLFRTN
ncbi:unnamed protein product [Eruca vesicaria subsp. sativa]|uniref:F-box domain-containing protein n=1 Tax=Eruca vesicaria subsp. sativa TaxID=29727 RepID=A0ABC8LI90_ERUVS|nr:unnamed protein product [Eruca vesicaria subsp. sativa]